jgi:hypothetical protein
VVIRASPICGSATTSKCLPWQSISRSGRCTLSLLLSRCSRCYVPRTPCLILRPEDVPLSTPLLQNQRHVRKTNCECDETGKHPLFQTHTHTNNPLLRANISAVEKKAYIASVLCLTTAPSKLSPTTYPGAKSRYDDFVAIHMKNSLSIHSTGNFLSWHRYFTFAYENALRTECGYNGTQPYWDWGRWSTPETSPLFDGSDTSMSSQGEKVKHNSNGLKPAGEGGGCIVSGPFKNMKVNLG